MLRDPRVELVVLADPDRAQAERLAAEFDLQTTIMTDERSALENPSLDFALLASPTTVHHRQAMIGLKSGLHLLIEKPLASSVHESAEIDQLAKEQNRLVGVAYQRRFEALYRTARREIQERSTRYGEIHAVHIYVAEHWSPSIVGTWRDDPTISGGFFADGGSHQVDAAFFITGQRARRVRATIDHRGRNVAIQTRVEAELTGGARLHAHFVGDAHQWREDIVFHGTLGDIVLKNGQELECWHQDRMSRILDGEEGSSPSRAFIDALARHGRGESVSFDSPISAGREMLSWTEAVLASARSGDWVDVCSP
jgi:predicted dehydrogenase